MRNTPTLRQPWLVAFTLLLSLLAGRAGAQAPAWAWATSPGISSSSTGTAVDAAGNVYVTGSFVGTATFGATTLSSAGGGDIFIAKLNPSGSYLWAVRAGGINDYEVGRALTVDGSGNVWVTGEFTSSTADFGATTLTNPNGLNTNQLFVAKLSAAGTWLWALNPIGQYQQTVTAIAVDGNGDAYVTGGFFGTQIRFGAVNLSGQFGSVFVVKLNSGGAWQWAVGGGGNTSLDRGLGLALDGSGNIYVSGFFFSSSPRFGTTTLANAGGGAFDGFVAKLSPAGTWLWAKAIGGNWFDYANALAVSSSGDVYLAGNFESATAAFDAITLTNNGGGRSDVYVAKLSTVGAWQWVVQAGGAGPGGDYARALTLDASDNVYVAGQFSGTATFGAITLTQTGPVATDTSDVFVAKLSPAGVWQWAVGAGGTNSEGAYSLTLDGRGTLYVAGESSSVTATFGPTTITNTLGLYENSLFVARLGASGLGLPESSPTAPLALAPNPAHTTVQLSGAPGPTAILLDALGRVVRTGPLTQGAATLDLRHLSPGLYLVRAGQQARRLVVE